MSKKRPKTSLVNLLRNRKTAIAAALCICIAVGAYVGVHMFSSQAGTGDPDQLRGTINDISEIKGRKSGASRNFGVDSSKNELGSTTNPFVILDIVPWQGYGEMSYMFSGCQPANLYKTYTGTSMQGLNAMNMGLAVPYAFEDELYPGKKNADGSLDEASDAEFGEVSRPWTLSDKDMTLYGYYEKIAGNNQSPEKVITKYVLDSVATDEDGVVYPVFREATSDETAEYFWVTLGNSENGIYKNHKARENKKFSADMSGEQANANMKAGDRFYMARTGRAYCMGSMPDETCKFYHADDMLRYSLRIRTQYEVEKYNVVVKTIEPWELNEHPEWLDYADLMYIHESCEYGASSQFYNDAVQKDPDGSKGFLYIDTGKSRNVQNATYGRYGNGEYKDKQNDITFEVALKLFKKCNKFDEYNGTQISSTDSNLKMHYAPIIVGSRLFQGNFMDSVNDSPTRMLDWATMTPAKNGNVHSTAYDNNVYKFCLMDLLMDQTVFYNNFIRTRVSTGKSVIQTREDGVGIAEPHEGKAQQYWNIYTFMPYENNVGRWSEEVIKKYGLKTDGNSAPYYQGNQGVNNFTYVYNNNGKIYYLAGEDDIEENASTGQVFDFYDEQDEHKDSVSTQDIIYYMLHYDKSDSGSNGKDGTIEILDIEPCSDFTLMNIDYLLVLFPASDEYMFSADDFNITHMTTSEFNGSKEDLSKYDLVYFGNSTGKMNTTGKSAYTQDASGSYVTMTYDAPQYNDTRDAESDKIFQHVGDLIKGDGTQYRLSGNDVTTLRADALEKFVKSGRPLVLPDILYMGKSNSIFSSTVGSGTNTESFLNNVRKKDNVYALSALTTQNLIDFSTGGASVKITGTPPSYNNPVDNDASVKDEDGNDSGSVSLGTIEKDKTTGEYNLTFTFKIGYTRNKDEKYAVRLLIDKNGDGLISENETGADILDTWNSTVSAGQTFAPGTLDDEGVEQPAEYTVSYTIPSDQTNGPIAWKFIVYSTLNESIYYEVSGISLYKGETDENGDPVVHEVTVLQIVSNDKDNTKANLESNNSLFDQYANLKDYKITVKTITLSEYLKRFEEVNSSGADDATRTLFAQGDKEFYYPVEFMDYSIMLYSCGSDLQNASNANGAVSFAAWVSNNDKSVVYTNNSITASGSNADNRDILKDAAGLSRFSSKDGTTSRYNDTAKDAAGKAYSASDYESLEYTYYKATLGGRADSNKYLAFNNDSWQTVDGKTGMNYNAGKQVATKGSQANKGTVCIYPYTIGESLSLTGAQAQDYQLNMEIPDADVWYCLGDYQGRGNAAGKLNTYYAISPNDPTNNYYLYNVDSVFYDAIELESTTVAQEMQLFINTLIGAYEFSYGTPYVTVDKVTQLDGTEEELREDSITTKERRYSFEVTAGETFVKTTLYKEYLKNEKDKVVHTAKPKVKDPAEPTPEPTATPEPTKAPEPITIWENQFNQNATNFEAERNSGADWLTGLSNNAVIQFTYTSTEEVEPDSALWDVYGGDNAWTKRATLTACVGNSTKSTDVQIVQMTIGDLKDILGVSDSKDIDYLVIRPANYWAPHARMMSIKLYDEGFSGSFDQGGSSGSKDANTEIVSKKDVFGDDDTHIIYFTPHEGNVKGSIIKSFMIQFTGLDKDNDEAISLPVTTIYRSLGDGEYEKITSPEGQPGQFNETLIDGKQYFITYDKENVNNANSKIFNMLEMFIQNDRKESKTYLEIIPNEEEKSDSEEVYMFNLD